MPIENPRHRNIQRCAVSRRTPTAKVHEEIHLISSRANGPLRAFHMPIINPNGISVKSSSRHSLTVEKVFPSRTGLKTVLPSSILLKNSKNNDYH